MAGIGSPMEEWRPLPPRGVREYRERIERIAAQIAVAMTGGKLSQHWSEETILARSFEIAKGIVDRIDAAEPPK